MQAGINGVRASGAKQMIFVEGTSWTGAWTWTTSGNSNAFTNLTDPANNFAIGAHIKRLSHSLKPLTCYCE